jgi:hypothetical protein
LTSLWRWLFSVPSAAVLGGILALSLLACSGSAAEPDGTETAGEAAVVFVTPTPTPTPEPPAVLLPDLRPLSDFLQNHYIEYTGTATILRFDTGFGNWGLGAFEMRGERASFSDRMTAYQRLFKSDGTFEDVEAGEMEYKDTHLHWHITDLALYELLDPEGNTVLSRNKAGFCLLDTYFVDPRPETGPTVPAYYTCTEGYEETLTVTPMGLSSGWYDIYEAFLPDQELDVTGFAPGTYRLRVTVDANDRILEADETNNVMSVEVELP